VAGTIRQPRVILLGDRRPAVDGWPAASPSELRAGPVELLTGGAPEPRAWDYFWNYGGNVVARAKLKSGTWVGGVYMTPEQGRGSYASGFPEEGDLYLAVVLEIDPVAGAVTKNDSGDPRPVEPRTGLLVRWLEIEYLTVQEFLNG